MIVSDGRQYGDKGLLVKRTHSHDTRVPGSERDTSRSEAFSDGVFSIAITLLVLEFRILPAPDLRTALLKLGSSYLAYVLSFVTMGIYWARHHYILKFYRYTNHTLKLLSLLFLMFISFLPFPTNVLAEYLRQGKDGRTAATFYSIGLFLPAFSWLLKWLYASHHRQIIDPHLDPQFEQKLTRIYGITVTLYFAGIVMSLTNYKLGLCVSVGLTLLYVLPPLAPIYVPEEQLEKEPPTGRAA
ncbi:MAG: hypothetical protein JWQ49_5033 [Edaphobacter sp.]|nr:hypothetical protein [Edaphobacter sp.]